MLKEWARLRELYSQNVQLSKNSDGDSVYLEMFDKIRIAGFQSESVEDYSDAARFTYSCHPIAPTLKK
jgi:hypothetical protein